MPLKGLSFEEIVKKEMDAGKPQKQAVAIAYEVTGKKNDQKDMSDKDLLDWYEKEREKGSNENLIKELRMEIKSRGLSTKSNDLSAMERFDSTSSRVQRGTERYASKKENSKSYEQLKIMANDENQDMGTFFDELAKSFKDKKIDSMERMKLSRMMDEGSKDNKKNEDENIEGHTKIQRDDRAFQNEDEASVEEHQIQEDEVLKKKEMKIQRKNSDNVNLKVQKTSKDIWSLVGVHQKHGGNGANAILFKTKDEAITKGRELEKETKSEPRPYKLESIENSTVIVRIIK